MEKICRKCGALKNIEEYYVHKKMLDGYLNICKTCTKERISIREKKLYNDKDWHDKEKTRAREKYYRLGYKELHKPTADQKKIAMNSYFLKFPEKYKARSLSGKVKVKGNHLHHWSYNLEHAKDVIELPQERHYTLHRHIVYDQERMMYRNLDGLLLDTKESHIELLKSLEKTITNAE